MIQNKSSVTAAMTLAGVYALDGFNWEMDSAFATVDEIYGAMEAARERDEKAAALDR